MSGFQEGALFLSLINFDVEDSSMIIKCFMSGIPVMWLFLTTTCLMYGTLNANGFFNLENEANPEVWMNIVSHGNSEVHHRRQSNWAVRLINYYHY